MYITLLGREGRLIIKDNGDLSCNGYQRGIDIIIWYANDERDHGPKNSCKTYVYGIVFSPCMVKVHINNKM